MMDFLQGCIGLFNEIFNAAIGVDVFALCVGFLVFQVGLVMLRLAFGASGKPRA